MGRSQGTGGGQAATSGTPRSGGPSDHDARSASLASPSGKPVPDGSTAGNGAPKRGRGRPRQAEGPAVTRDAIVAVALRAVQANGSAGLALREVARELEVSLPTLQRHFATKDDLWRACVDAALEQVGNELASAPAPAAGEDQGQAQGQRGTGGGPVLTWHLRQQIERAARIPRLTAAMSNDSEPGAEDRLEYLLERARPLIDRSRGLVQAAIDTGVARPVDVEVFMALVSLGLGSLASSHDGLRRLHGIDLDDANQRDRYVAGLADLLLYGLVPRQEERPA